MDVQLLEKIIEDQRIEFFETTSGISRAIDFERHLGLPEISVISGVRRCGKSTLLRRIADSSGWSVCFLNLDDPRLVEFEQQDFATVYELWMKRLPLTPERILILLDEVQNVSGWEQWATMFARKKGHKVFITGSNSKLLSSELSTHLTGRHFDIEMYPLSFSEIYHYSSQALLNRSSPRDVAVSADIAQGSTGQPSTVPASTAQSINLARAFDRYLRYGGFPRVFLDNNLGYLPLYYEDVVVKDILVRKKLRNVRALRGLARILATETSRIFSNSNTAKVLGLKDDATVDKYCSYFVESFLFFELKQFSTSLRKQRRSKSKYYCIDHALARSNGFWKGDGDAIALELMVCLELQRRNHEIYYWHSKNNYEVDFVLTHGPEPIQAIQVSYSVNDPVTLNRELRALSAAAKELNVTDLIIVTHSERRNIEQHGMQVKLIPFVEWAFSS